MAARTPDRPRAAGVKPMWLAAPEELEPLPPVAVVLALPGLVREPLHWYLPLMTSDGPCMSLNTSQELVMSAVDWRLKAPRLSLRAGRETLIYVRRMYMLGEKEDYSRGEVSVHVGGTSDGGQSWEGDLLKNGVVLDLDTTGDLLEQRHGDVGQLWVGVDGEGAANGGQVRAGKVLEAALVETKGAAGVGEGWDRDAWDITEGDVGSSDQVGERKLQLVTVRLDIDGTSQVGDLEADVLEQVVVGNVDGVDLLQVDAVQCAQESVLNVQ